MESVAIEIPGIQELDLSAGVLRPGVAVDQRRVEREGENAGCEENTSQALADDGSRREAKTLDAARKEIEFLAKHDESEVKGREVVVKEQLAGHEVEREVVESPSQYAATDFVVESLEVDIAVVATASLPAKNRNTLEEKVNANGHRRGPPNEGVSEEVNLTVVFTPEVDTAEHSGPRRRARVPGMRLSQAGVGLPHHLLKFPELTKKSGVTVVDLLGVLRQHGVRIGFDVPHTVGQSTTPRTSNFLLVISPLGQLHLVGEQDAASHDVDQAELRLNSPKALLRLITVGHGLDDFNSEEVIGVTSKAVVTISGDLELPVNISDRRPLIVRVDSSARDQMVQPDNGAVFDVIRGDVIPGKRTLHFAVGTQGLGLVFEDKNVVLVLVRIESDLLLLTSGGVHVVVRVKVATLSVKVTDADARAEDHIGRDILHRLGVEGRLELGRHESVAFSGVDQAEEMDGEHSAVEAKRDDDKTEDTGKEVLKPDTLHNDVLANPNIKYGR